jgi:protein-disulfide isomerase
MIEFSDYECPFCRSFTSNTFPRIEQQYIKTGKLKYYTFSFPLKGHANAALAARAALCANDRGKFWEMHERLLFRQDGDNLTRDGLIRKARDLRLDDAGFQECLDMGGHSDEVARDSATGEGVGVLGIPCFLLGFTDPESNNVQVARLVDGARPFEQFKEVIDELLSSRTP